MILCIINNNDQIMLNNSFNEGGSDGGHTQLRTSSRLTPC